MVEIHGVPQSLARGSLEQKGGVASALFAEVREHFCHACLACRQRQNEKIGYAPVRLVPEPLLTPFSGTLSSLTRMERTIFEFPEVKWGVSQLSLKEQVDLQRFLTAKRHFLTNQDRVIDLLLAGLRRIFRDVFYELPELAGPSPFTIPFINAHPYPRECMARLYGIVWDEAYIDNGLFVEVGRQMHFNICAVSKISDPNNPKGRPYLIPTENDAPLEELVEAYFKGTPFEYLLMAPVPLRLSYEDRFSHCHIVGGSGAGKTQLLQHMILHDLQAVDPPALIIVDSQTDLINKIAHLDLFDPVSLRHRRTLGAARDRSDDSAG